MKIINIKVKDLSQKTFSSYGTVLRPKIDKPTYSNNEFDLWLGIDNIVSVNNAQISWLSLKTKRELTCNKLERHMKSSESIIPMQGRSIIIVGISKKSSYKDLVDFESISAFHMDGSSGVNLSPGVWHWIPYPLTNYANFLLILGEDIDKNDLEIINLEERFGLKFKIDL